MKILKKKHVMTDIESLNSTPDAIILSIGACKFHFMDGITETFYVNVDPVSCKEYGLTSSRDTVEWWKKQSKEALAAFKSPAPVDLVTALTQYFDFCKGVDYVWAHGQFDLPILEMAASRTGVKPSYLYHQQMDNRTVMTLLDSKVPRDKSSHHNALADAVAQAAHLATVFEQDDF